MELQVKGKQDDRMIETTMESKSSVAMLKILGQKLFDTMGVRGNFAGSQTTNGTKISVKKQLPGFEKQHTQSNHQTF